MRKQLEQRRKQRSRPRSDNNGAEPEGGDEWLLTYGDLMTQLVCFFVLLMSFSVISMIKFREAASSLKDILAGNGVLESGIKIGRDDSLPTHIAENIANDSMIELSSEIKSILEKRRMLSHVSLEVRGEGLVIILEQQDPPLFFDTANARVKEEAYPILDEIGKFIASLTNNISVAGHTDIRPIDTPEFPSNWELSSMRATNVMRTLQKSAGIAPGRFSVAGYGPYRPIASNDTKLGMAKNRRVEIVVLRTLEESD